MLRMRNSGATLEQIADTYGLTRQRVWQIIGSSGKNARMDIAVEKAKYYISENPMATWKEVAAYTGCSMESLKNHGVEKAPARTNNRRWTRAEAVTAGLRWKKKHGKAPTSSTRMTGDMPSTVTIYRIFGNWNEFRKALDEADGSN